MPMSGGEGFVILLGFLCGDLCSLAVVHQRFVAPAAITSFIASKPISKACSSVGAK